MNQQDFDQATVGASDWDTLCEDAYVEAERFVARLYGNFDDVTTAKYKLLATKTISSES